MINRLWCLICLLCLGVAAAQTPPPAAQRMAPPPFEKRVGILLFPGVQVIDFSGPYEVLSQGAGRKGLLFQVVTVGPGADAFQTSPPWSGLNLKTDYTFDNCPKLDILVVPGGNTRSIENDERAMRWLKETSDKVECVMSVCNGAMILAKAGLLKDLKATTTFSYLDALKKAEPTCTVVYDQRFVDNGKIVTTAGLTSGIDGAIHLIERFGGGEIYARQAALGLEYNWQPKLNFARANLADRHLIRMIGRGFTGFADDDLREWQVEENDGTTTKWTKRWTFASVKGLEPLATAFDTHIGKAWKASAHAGTDGWKTTTWSFSDEAGRPWTAKSGLRRVSEGRFVYEISLSSS